MSKSLKIMTFCATLTFILCSCNSYNTHSSFSYSDPSSSFDNVFVFDVDFSNDSQLNNSLNEQIEIDDLLSILTTNDLYNNISKVTYKNYNLYDYGQNDNYETLESVYDDGNYLIDMTLDITRDNTSYTASGNIYFKQDKYILNENDELINDSYTVNDGLYSVTHDVNNRTLLRKFDFKNELFNNENQYYLTNYNLEQLLNLTNTNYFLDYYHSILNLNSEASPSLSYQNNVYTLKLLSTKTVINDNQDQLISNEQGVEINISNGVITKLEYFNCNYGSFVDGSVENKLLSEYRIINELSNNYNDKN